MMYYDFEAGGETYKLRLNTRQSVVLEKMLGKNPLMVLTAVTSDNLPKISEMCAVLHASLQELNHGVSMDKVYDIFDDYLADGHTPSDFIGVIVEVYKVSGLLDGGEEKN